MSQPSWFRRLTIAVAGILGAVGIIGAAGATHSGDQALLGPLSLIALTQAPALLALGLLAAGGIFYCLATGAIGLGAAVFCGDLAVRHFTRHALFPMSAPIGGTAMIIGWALLVPAAFIAWRAAGRSDSAG